MMEQNVQQVNTSIFGYAEQQNEGTSGIPILFVFKHNVPAVKWRLRTDVDIQKSLFFLI